jgi:mRNA interferase HicA
MHGCALVRQGKHEIWWNPTNGATAAVPRHIELARFTIRQICRDLGIPEP